MKIETAYKISFASHFVLAASWIAIGVGSNSAVGTAMGFAAGVWIWVGADNYRRKK